MKKYIFILFLMVVGCKKSENDQASLVKLFIPNAFNPDSQVPCPNGNVDCNRTFYAIISDSSVLKSWEFHIYSSQQKQVFYTTNYKEGWGGRVNNTSGECPMGAYQYLIKYTDIKNTVSYKSGDVMLLR